MVILHVMTVWQKHFFKEQLKEAERRVNQENPGYPTSKKGPKWTYILFSPLPKIAYCGEVCASRSVRLRHKPREAKMMMIKPIDIIPGTKVQYN